MGAATFLQTNFTTQDSTTYKTSIDADIQVLARLGQMFAPHQTGTPAMTITIDAGALFVSNALVVQAAQTSGTITAPVSNPRIDRAVIDAATGVLSIITGAEAGSPSPPAITAGKLPVAQIALIVGQVTILNANITDERIGAGAGSSSTVDNSVNDFRPTLTTGVPVTTSDVASSSNIYMTPYKGNRIALYDGASWNIRTSAEFSKALSGLTFGGNIPYDIFVYDNAGTPTIEFLIWTNTTTRATAIIYQDGAKVKSGDATRRYVGCFIPLSATTTCDTAAQRYLESEYNQVDRPLSGTFSADRSTASATYVELNTEIRIQFVVGADDKPIQISVNGTMSVTGTGAGSSAVAIDSTSVATAGLEAGGNPGASGQDISIAASAPIVVAIGYHYATILGKSYNSLTSSWRSSTSSTSAVKDYLLASKKG